MSRVAGGVDFGPTASPVSDAVPRSRRAGGPVADHLGRRGALTTRGPVALDRPAECSKRRRRGEPGQAGRIAGAGGRGEEQAETSGPSGRDVSARLGSALVDQA